MADKMTSKERVMAAFDHEEPDHVPAWLGASPEFRKLLVERLGLADDEALSVYLGDDFRRVQATYAGPKEFSPDQIFRPVRLTAPRSGSNVLVTGMGCRWIIP